MILYIIDKILSQISQELDITLEINIKVENQIKKVELKNEKSKQGITMYKSYNNFKKDSKLQKKYLN